MDLTDQNIGHFMNEVMLPLWHSLLNVELIPAHVKKCGKAKRQICRSTGSCLLHAQSAYLIVHVS